MYWKPPSAAELATLPGAHKASDFQEPTVEVWDENWDVVCLFSTFSKQIRYSGMGVATGLDMSIFLHELDRKGITGDEYDEFVDDLGTIERAVLKVLNKRDD